MDATLPVPRRLLLRLWAGVMGVMLFMIVATLQGLVRPDYDAWHQSVSALSLGPAGWIQSLNFPVLGLVLLSTVAPWREVLAGGRGDAWYPALTALIGFSLILLGLIPQDPAPGYDPAGLSLDAPTAVGLLHLALAGVMAGSLVACLFVIAARLAGDARWPGWSRSARVTAVLVVAFISVYAFWSTESSGFAGTFERLGMLLPPLWGTAFIWRLGRGAPFMAGAPRALEARRWTPLSVVTLASTPVIIVVLGTAAVKLPSSRTTQLFGELVTHVRAADSVVALTFDDGPSPVYTDSVLDLLREEGVSATFFVIGNSVEKHPALARRIVREGHELGNHSLSHQRMLLMSQRTIKREVERTDSLIRATGAEGLIHFRPPYFKRLVGLPWYLARNDRPTILATLEPDSWLRERDAMVRHVLEEARPGAIILLHVEMRSRVEERGALRPMIQGLKARGFRLVTLSELMRRRR